MTADSTSDGGRRQLPDGAFDLANIDRLVAAVPGIHVRPGSLLTARECAEDQGFVILEGRAEIVVNDEPVANAGPGSVVRAPSSSRGKGASTVVRALTPMRVTMVRMPVGGEGAAAPAMSRLLALLDHVYGSSRSRN